MTDLHAMRQFAAGLSDPELAAVRAELDRQFARMPIPEAPARDDELPDPADSARRPVSQTTGD